MEWLLAFLEANSTVLGAGGAVVGLIVVVLGPFKWLVNRGKKTEVNLSKETIKEIAPNVKTVPQLTIAEFIAIRREMKADLEAELASAHDNEKAQLGARIAELESQIANPDAALAVALKQVADLEARLERMGNEIGGDRLAEARVALERLDYSIADAIFAEVEERRKLEVQEAARAAYGRGEVAEAEVRWLDAAEHYARAARLDPNIGSLLKAHEFTHWSGDFSKALSLGEEMVALAETDHVTEKERADVFNDQAVTLQAIGRFDEAEKLNRRALAIRSKALGKEHADSAKSLNNLALLLHATGRHDEAEPLFREALAVRERALGKAHPDYAGSLNNLAGLLHATGRHDEAEPLFREALAVRERALGKAHPDYAASLNNLAALLDATGRQDEAEPLYREALAVRERALGKAHPDYAASLNNLEVFLAERGIG